MHDHTCGDRFLSNVRLLSGNSANLGVNRMRQAVEAKLQIGSQVSQLLAEQCTDHGHLLPRGHSHGAKLLRRRRHQLVIAVVVLVVVILCCPCRSHYRRRINKYTTQCSICHQHQDHSLIKSTNSSDSALYKQSANQPASNSFPNLCTVLLYTQSSNEQVEDAAKRLNTEWPHKEMFTQIISTPRIILDDVQSAWKLTRVLRASVLL